MRDINSWFPPTSTWPAETHRVWATAGPIARFITV
jgi:hypothetical protein